MRIVVFPSPRLGITPKAAFVLAGTAAAGAVAAQAYQNRGGICDKLSDANDAAGKFIEKCLDATVGRLFDAFLQK